MTTHIVHLPNDGRVACIYHADSFTVFLRGCGDPLDHKIRTYSWPFTPKRHRVDMRKDAVQNLLERSTIDWALPGLSGFRPSYVADSR